MVDVIQYEGRPVFVRGFATIWNSVSHPVPALGNRPSLFLPSAFDDVLKRPMLSLNCQAYHLGHAVMGSLRDRNLQVWADAFGLAFCVGPMPATPGSAALIRAITAGETRGASTSTTTAEEAVRTIDGEEVVVIKRIKTLHHLSPVAGPSDDATAVWCSHEPWERLTPRIRALADIWSTNKPRHDPAAALAHIRERAAARKPTARARPAAVSMAVHDTYPAGLGFSSAELGRLATLDTIAMRAMKACEQLRFERQREASRAKRRERRVA